MNTVQLVPRRRRPPLALGAGLLLGMIGAALLFVLPPLVGIVTLALSALVIVATAAIGIGTFAKRRLDERRAARQT